MTTLSTNELAQTNQNTGLPNIKSRIKAKENFSYPMIFVHSYLDLYGLDPYQFRLLAHIARRNNCVSKLEKMALICNMSTRKAQDVLQELDELGLVIKKLRRGKTSLCRVAPFTNWEKPKPKPELEEKYNSLLNKLQEEQQSLTKLEEERKDVQMIFVHGYLDLYYLDPYEFRLLAYVACRSICSSPLQEIAFICKMGMRKAQDTFQKLKDLELVSKERRGGRPTTYRLRDFSDWKEPQYIAELEAERLKVRASMLCKYVNKTNNE
jgi:predicted transcriptional regulator